MKPTSPLTHTITGIIPAAGFASRLPNLPCSKEIYPIGIDFNKDDKRGHVKVVSASLLGHMSKAGAKCAFMIIRKEKWDVPQFLMDGSNYNINLSFVVTTPTDGTPYSILKAIPFVKDDIVLFGFPDILISANNPFKKLLDVLREKKSDVVLGLFEADNPEKADMVKLNHNNNIEEILIKPGKTSLRYTWLLAVWNSTFSELLPEFIKHSEAKDLNREIHIGNIFNIAIKKGLKVNSILLKDSRYIDIGTTDDLQKALKM